MPQPADVSPASFEPAKWAAVIAMTIDHVGKVLVTDWYEPTHLIGRIAFPLFAWIIASRLAAKPETAQGYVRWLLPWALISQPVFFIAGRDWYDGNILFTLLAGVLVVRALDHFGHGRTAWLIAAALATCGLLLDYGPAGVLAIPVLVAAARNGARASLVALALVGVAVNFPFPGPFYFVAALASLAAVPVAAAALFAPGASLPRLPRTAFYAFYPVHLLVLALLARIATA